MKIPSYLFRRKSSGIYCIENSFNGKRYIGSTLHLYGRLHKHNSLLNHEKHENRILQNSWKKHGSDVFECYVLEFCEENELIELEQKWINELNPEYNITRIVERNVLSAESKKLISKTLKEGYSTGRILPTKVRKIKAFNLDGIFVGDYDKISDCAEKLKISVSGIERCLSKTYKQCKGYQFKYYEDDSEIKKITKSKYLRRFDQSAPL